MEIIHTKARKPIKTIIFWSVIEKKGKVSQNKTNKTL